MSKAGIEELFLSMVNGGSGQQETAVLKESGQ